MLSPTHGRLAQGGRQNMSRTNTHNTHSTHRYTHTHTRSPENDSFATMPPPNLSTPHPIYALPVTHGPAPYHEYLCRALYCDSCRASFGVSHQHFLELTVRMLPPRRSQRDDCFTLFFLFCIWHVAARQSNSI